MSSFADWLDRAAEDERTRVSLEEALIGERFAAYARHRLRWVALGRSTALVVHLIEFAFLAHIFGQRGLAGALVLHNACGLAAGFWWGGLELLRNRLQGASKPHSSHEISVWLGRAALVSALLVVGLGVGVGLHWTRAGVDLLGAYALVVGLRLAADIVARTYYSGVYARRRVYRPVLAILATEVVGLATIGALWTWLGAWSFPIGLAVSVVVSRAVLVWYTARAYDAHRVARPGLAVRRGLRVRGGGRDALTFAVAGLAGASTRLGSLLVLLVLLGAGGSAGAAAIILHLCVPLITTAGSWPQVFYLDFRRLDDPLAAGLRRRLGRKLAPLAIAVGLCLWVVACAVVLTQVDAATATVPMVALAPLFVAQSWLGRVQLEYFARKQYLRVAAGGLAVACGALVALAGAGELARVGGAVSRPLAVTAAVGLGVAVTELWWSSRRPRPVRGRVRSLLTWLGALAECRGQVRVGGVRAHDARADQLAYLADWIAERVGEGGAVVSVRGHRLLWFEVDGATVDRRELVVAAGGLADRVEVTDRADGGAAALAKAVELGLLEPPAGDDVADAAALVARFRALFPDGMVERVDGPRGGGELGTLEPPVRRALWLDAVTDARGGRRSRPRSGFEVSSYVRGGEIAALFVAPRDAPLDHRRRWRGILERANWDASTRPPAVGHDRGEAGISWG